ncbi:AF4/FMR2 family member 1-like [Schistocerca americana]|uniref:AF4/FMR2 family member 1-like n=1 Tax=Schistocerca americana TaxID=7009 RepID=UPI001F503F49|nr:AF4/FMR2 family member 1-like [Schistocerca americana]
MGKIGPQPKLAQNKTPDGEKTQLNNTTPQLLSPAEQRGREKETEFLAKEMAKKKLAKPASAKYYTARQSRQNSALSAPPKNIKGTRVGITKPTRKSPNNRVASTSASASRPTMTNTSVNSTPRQQQGAGRRKSQIPTKLPHSFESPNRFDALGDSDEEGETTATPDVNPPPPPQQTPQRETSTAPTATSHDDNSTPAAEGQQQSTDSGEDETNPRNVPPIGVYQLEGYTKLNKAIKDKISGPLKAIFRGDSVKYNFESLSDYYAAAAFLRERETQLDSIELGSTGPGPSSVGSGSGGIPNGDNEAVLAAPTPGSADAAAPATRRKSMKSTTKARDAPYSHASRKHAHPPSVTDSESTESRAPDRKKQSTDRQDPAPPQNTSASHAPTDTSQVDMVEAYEVTVPTSNRYESLDDITPAEQNSDNLPAPTPLKTPKVPPIIVHDTTNYLDRIKELKGHLKGSFSCQYKRGNIRYEFENPSDYRYMIEYLKARAIQYHTYDLDPLKILKVVVRHLEPTTPPADVKEALEELGFTVQSVTVMHQQVPDAQGKLTDIKWPLSSTHAASAPSTPAAPPVNTENFPQLRARRAPTPPSSSAAGTGPTPPRRPASRPATAPHSAWGTANPSPEPSAPPPPTFSFPFSNHLADLAALLQQFNIPKIISLVRSTIQQLNSASDPFSKLMIILSAFISYFSDGP